MQSGLQPILPLERILHAGKPSYELKQSPFGAFLGHQLRRRLASELHQVLYHPFIGHELQGGRQAQALHQTKQEHAYPFVLLLQH